MSMIRKLLGGSAITAVVSLALVGTAQAEVCDTPSAMGDMGKFEGEVITIAGIWASEISIISPDSGITNLR